MTYKTLESGPLDFYCEYSGISAEEVIPEFEAVARSVYDMVNHPVPHVDRMPDGSPYTQYEGPAAYAKLIQHELDVYLDPSTNIIRRIARLKLIAATAIVAAIWETREFFKGLKGL